MALLMGRPQGGNMPAACNTTSVMVVMTTTDSKPATTAPVLRKPEGCDASTPLVGKTCGPVNVPAFFMGALLWRERGPRSFCNEDEAERAQPTSRRTFLR